MSRYDVEVFLDHEREEARGARDAGRDDLTGLYPNHDDVPPSCPHRGPGPCPSGECATGCAHAE